MEYMLIDIGREDACMQAKLDKLLAQNGLQRDAALDYSAGIVDENYRLLATGSCAQNTLRCIAVDEEFRGEGFLNSIVSRLTEIQTMRGNSHIFVYTKSTSAPFFRSLGYRRIAEVDGKLSFMENRARGFSDYLDSLGAARSEASCAVVMNANPFTLGHLHIIKQASREGFVHVFVVAEDVSQFSFAQRFQMVREGCAGLPGVAVHSTGSYIISSATFPAYFLGANDDAVRIQARLDAEIFSSIAERLNISKRFFGQEPYSHTTSLYNQIMLGTLPSMGIKVEIIPRLEIKGKPVSASAVRAALQQGNRESAAEFLPPSSLHHIVS